MKMIEIPIQNNHLFEVPLVDDGVYKDKLFKQYDGIVIIERKVIADNSIEYLTYYLDGDWVQQENISKEYKTVCSHLIQFMKTKEKDKKEGKVK